MSTSDKSKNQFKPLIAPSPPRSTTHLHHNIYNQIQLDWYIPPEDRHKLSNYYILHWTPEYLFSNWGQHRPIIREGITYLIIYHRCHPEELRGRKVVLLSFRKLPDMRTGYVLVTPAKNAMEYITERDQKSMLPPDRS